MGRTLRLQIPCKDRRAMEILQRPLAHTSHVQELVLGGLVSGFMVRGEKLTADGRAERNQS